MMWSCCTEGALFHFINYGMSVLKPADGVYQRTVDGTVSATRCAELCLNETQFYCLSFDLLYAAAPASVTGSGTVPSDRGQCRLSQHVAASAGGLVFDRRHPHQNHFERIGQPLTVAPSVSVGRRQVQKCGVDTHGEFVECEPITRCGGGAASGVQGQSSGSQGPQGAKLKTF